MRSITYSRAMIIARLAGRKTMTRRVKTAEECPYGSAGDHLLVKEAAWLWCRLEPNGVTPTGRQKIKYVPEPSVMPVWAATRSKKPEWEPPGHWIGNHAWRYKIPRYMPFWASRWRDEVIAIRREPLRQITEADAVLEGVTPRISNTETGRTSYVEGFKAVWDFIHGTSGPNSWDANPEVWVVTFKPHRTNA